MRRLELKAALLASAIAAIGFAAQAEERYGIGRPATPAEIAGWNIDIGRDGSNLPPGSGSVERGRVVFSEQCAACHGDNGQGGIGDRLVGGQGTLATPSRSAPSAATGLTPRRCSTTSAAPCRRTPRSR